MQCLATKQHILSRIVIIAPCVDWTRSLTTKIHNKRCKVSLNLDEYFRHMVLYLSDRRPLISFCTSIAKCPDAKPSNTVIEHVWAAVNTRVCILQDRFGS